MTLDLCDYSRCATSLVIKSLRQETIITAQHCASFQWLPFEEDCVK